MRLKRKLWIQGNLSLPQGQKVRPDKHKMQDPLNDTGQIELEPTIKLRELTIKHEGCVRSDLFKRITEHQKESLPFTFLPLLFIFLQLLLNFTVQVYASLNQYPYLLLKHYLEVSMKTFDKVKISDATINYQIN